MKKSFTCLLSYLLMAMLLLSSCTKTVETPSNGSGSGSGSGSGGGSGGGTGGGGSTTSTITIQNPSFTPMTVTLNGQTQTAAVGGTAVFTGTAGTVVSGNASTSGTTSSGTQVGLKLTWSYNLTFPAATTNYNYKLDVGSNYFFLKITNNSTKSLLKVYVNYGLVSQTLDNITVANDGRIYFIGYYSAYTNSNVRAENGTTYWTWNTLSLPFTTNQSQAVIAN